MTRHMMVFPPVKIGLMVSDKESLERESGCLAMAGRHLTQEGRFGFSLTFFFALIFLSSPLTGDLICDLLQDDQPEG